jgi:hypothetical protein
MAGVGLQYPRAYLRPALHAGQRITLPLGRGERSDVGSADRFRF